MGMQEPAVGSSLGSHQRHQTVDGIQEPIWLPLPSSSQTLSADSTMHLFSLPSCPQDGHPHTVGAAGEADTGSVGIPPYNPCCSGCALPGEYGYHPSSSWGAIVGPSPSPCGGLTNNKHSCRPSHPDTVSSALSSSAQSQSCVGTLLHPPAIGETCPSSACRSPVDSETGPMVARLTGVVLRLVWASSPPTVPPLRLVLVAFKVSHLL